MAIEKNNKAEALLFLRKKAMEAPLFGWNIGNMPFSLMPEVADIMVEWATLEAAKIKAEKKAEPYQTKCETIDQFSNVNDVMEEIEACFVALDQNVDMNEEEREGTIESLEEELITFREMAERLQATLWAHEGMPKAKCGECCGCVAEEEIEAANQEEND